jgi:hypothetical protein
MDNVTSTGTDRAKRKPNLKDHEVGVQIIFVAVDQILNEMQLNTLGNGPIGTATLAQVAKHIGQPAPTDVVVFAKQPWHFAGRPGQSKELRRHPQVHQDFPETILVIRPKQEAVWWSEKEFQITTIKPSGDPAHPHPGFPEALSPPPQYPFTGTNPIATRLEPHSGTDFWIARSGIPKTEAHEHMYKISFKIDGDAIDPDGYCSGN